MSRSEVYSWRLPAELKRQIEQAARREGTSVAQLLDDAAREWLAHHAPEASEERQEARIRASVDSVIGSMRGGAPERASRARELVRERLKRRRAT